MINLILLRRLVRGHRIRIAVGAAVVMLWSLLFPVIYKAFVDQLDYKSPPVGNFSTLSGTISVGFIHPISIALAGMLSAGLTVGALSGERQRGTLELLLSRPISRRTVVATMLLEGWLGATLAAAAHVVGTIVGSHIAGVSGELAYEQLPALFAAGTLFWGSFATLALAASGSFDRTPPAMAITVGFIMANYIIEVLGQFWDVMEPYRFLSLFRHFAPEGILEQTADSGEGLIFIGLTLATAAWAFYKFPRRDLAAPN